MSETWFTSDTHLGHDLVARLRGFDSRTEHDEHLARQWDKHVRDDDEVWVLGDVAMNGWLRRLGWFSDRPGRKHLVLGNHDRAHPSQRNAKQYQRAYFDSFESVQTAASLRHEGEQLLLSHFPYDGEGEGRDPAKPDRYTQWRLRDEGTTLLHGHVHDERRLRTSAAGTPMIHVGLDSWGLRPVTKHDALEVAA